MQPERHLGDDAQRALRADEEPREVVARRRLARTRAGSDHATVRKHHRQAEHVVAHRPVAHRHRSRAARRGHAAERGIRARIDREEEAGVPDVGVQRLARHTRLHPAVEILDIDLKHLVHAAEIDAHATAHGSRMTLERRAGAECNDRRAVLCAKPHDFRDLLRGSGKHNHVGRLGGMIRLTLPVALADRRVRGDPFTQTPLQGIR